MGKLTISMAIFKFAGYLIHGDMAWPSHNPQRLGISMWMYAQTEEEIDKRYSNVHSGTTWAITKSLEKRVFESLESKKHKKCSSSEWGLQSTFVIILLDDHQQIGAVFSSQKSGKPGKWWKSGNRLDPDHPFELIAGLPLLISHAFCYSPRNQFVDKAPKGHQINQNVQKISMISEYSSSTDQSEFPEDIPISFHIFLAFHARLITALRPEPREELCSALMIVSSRRSSRLKGEDEPQKKATLKEMYKSI